MLEGYSLQFTHTILAMMCDLSSGYNYTSRLCHNLPLILTPTAHLETSND